MEPFRKPWVVIVDYATARDILVRRTPRETDSGIFFGQLLREIMPHHYALMESSQNFRERRRLLEPIVSSSFLNTVAAVVFVHCTESLISLWNKKCDLADGRAFNAEEDLQVYLTDAMVKMMLGQDIGGLSVRQQRLYSLDVPRRPESADDEIVFPAPSGTSMSHSECLTSCVSYSTELISAQAWLFLPIAVLPQSLLHSAGFTIALCSN